MLIALGIAVSTSGLTFALLSASASTPGATISAGTSGLLIDGAVSTDLGTVMLAPLTPVARAVHLENTGDVDLALTATATATANDLAASVTVRLTPIDGSADCTTGLDAPPAPLLGPGVPAGTLAAGDESLLCIELIIPEDTPASASGQTIAFTLTLRGDQIGATP